MTTDGSGSPYRIVFATANAGKLAEFRDIARRTGLNGEVVSLAELGIENDIEETGESFEENARMKAHAAAALLDRATMESAFVVAEDSGLVVDALDGFPGVNSKRIAENDPARIAIVLDRLRLADALDESMRAARFVCSAAIADSTGIVFETRGEVEGVIAAEPRGDAGFGYDPIFYHEPAARTFAEMTREEKSSVSHRGKALRQVCEWIVKHR